MKWLHWSLRSERRIWMDSSSRSWKANTHRFQSSTQSSWETWSDSCFRQTLRRGPHVLRFWTILLWRRRLSFSSQRTMKTALVRLSLRRFWFQGPIWWASLCHSQSMDLTCLIWGWLILSRRRLRFCQSERQTWLKVLWSQTELRFCWTQDKNEVWRALGLKQWTIWGLL